VIAYILSLDFLQLATQLLVVWFAWVWVKKAEYPDEKGRKIILGLLIVVVLVDQGHKLYVANAMANEAKATTCNPLSYTWNSKKCSE
jgi:hypothetical protein